MPLDLKRLRADIAELRLLPCFAGDTESCDRIDSIWPCIAKAAAEEQRRGAALPPPPSPQTNNLHAASMPPTPAMDRPAPLLTSFHDGGWTMMLTYLNLMDIMRCRSASKEVAAKVTECLNLLPLSDMPGVKWLTPEVLDSLASFRNVKAMQWFVSSGETVDQEEEGEETAGDAHQNRPWVTKHVALWAYLLGRLPRIEEVVLHEGPEGSTDEQALEELYEHVLPLCAPRLKSLTFSYERYSATHLDEDRPPINIKKLAVMLASRKPFPLLKELNFQMPSMSIMQQRSLVRALGRSGMLSRLERLAIGGGTTSYSRPKIGPGRDLADVLRKYRCPHLQTLYLQRVDIWDDIPALTKALGPTYCPVLKALHVNLTVDLDDAFALAKHLKDFPASLLTLGFEVLGMKGRTRDGSYETVPIEPAVEALAKALQKHPRPTLEMLELSLHYEDPEEQAQQASGGAGLMPKEDAHPLLDALVNGCCPNVQCLNLVDCKLGPAGFAKLREVLPHLPRLQLLELSGNFLTPEEALKLAPALAATSFVSELVAHDVASNEEDEKRLMDIFQGTGVRISLYDEFALHDHSGDENSELEDNEGDPNDPDGEEFGENGGDMAQDDEAAAEGAGVGEDGMPEGGMDGEGWDGSMEEEGEESDGEVPAELDSDQEMAH